VAQRALAQPGAAVRRRHGPQPHALVEGRRPPPLRARIPLPGHAVEASGPGRRAHDRAVRGAARSRPGVLHPFHHGPPGAPHPASRTRCIPRFVYAEELMSTTREGTTPMSKLATYLDKRADLRAHDSALKATAKTEDKLAAKEARNKAKDSHRVDLAEAKE